MPAIITSKFRIHNSEQFVESFSEAENSTYYLGIGGPLTWGTYTRGDDRTDNTGSDTSPIVPADNIAEELYTYDDLLAAKKITSSDVSYVIPRRNWTINTIYDYYRHDYGSRITGTTTTSTSTSGASNLYDATFYVLNSTNNVYKCLDNNQGIPSTVEPTGTSTSILSTGDGYKWKYMYTLSASQQINFLSTDFMAVATNSTVQIAAVDGGINIVKIKNGGTGGTNGTYTNIPIRGDGTGGTVTIVITGTAVTSVTVTSIGTGYTYGYIRVQDINTASSGFLTGAELDCIIEPKGGHGFDAVKELGGFFVMLNVNLEGNEITNTGDFTTENDFRKIVLIKDPESLGVISTASTLRTTKAVRISSSPAPGTFQVDETIVQSTTGAVGKVVEWDSINRILHYIQTRHTDGGINNDGNYVSFSGTNVITGASSGATGSPSSVSSETADNITFTNGYSASEIDADKGSVIYIENRAPISRAADQTENVKLIIEF
jgi:hypothetical protein